MRVLWIAGSEGLFSATSEGSYNGVGWVAGLQTAVKMYAENIDLGLAFLTNKSIPFKILKDGCSYYPVCSRKSFIEKALNRFGWNDKDVYRSEFSRVIDDFKPDLIHIFGVEMPYSYLVGCTKIPTVVHLQGFLNPYLNAYFPAGMGVESCFKHSKLKELLGLGFSYNYKAFSHSAVKEANVLSQCKNVMGRTLWDKQIADLMTNDARYFHVDEVLRPAFYDAPKWKYHYAGAVNIVTTISQAMYKGFDLVLKTSSLLGKFGIKYQWHVIGVSQDSEFVSLFERHFGIRKENVNVILHGRMEADEIIEQLLHTDLYVHTSYIDNSPNSVCEAQMLGIPVIACNVGGLSSLIENDVTGFLIPANAPFELAYMIKHYAELPILKVSSNEIDVAEKRHNRKEIINRLASCYAECVGSSGSN